MDESVKCTKCQQVKCLCQSDSDRSMDTEIECPNGCQQRLKRKEMENHMCPNEIITCLFQGCNEMVLRKDFDKHVQASLSKHLIIMYQQQLKFQQDILKKFEELNNQQIAQQKQFHQEVVNLMSQGVDKKLKIIGDQLHLCLNTHELKIRYSESKTLTGHKGWIYGLKKVDNEHFISCSADNTLKIWKFTGECIQTLKGHTSSVTAVLVLSDRTVVSASSDGTIIFWSSDGKQLNIIPVDSAIDCFVELRDGKIACGCSDGIYLLTQTGKLWTLGKMAEHSDGVSSIIQLQNGNLVSGSWDNTIKIWDIDNRKCINTLKKHTSSVTTLCILQNGGFVSGSKDNNIKIWNESGECVNTLIGHSKAVNAVIELKNGMIASGSSDNSIKIWNQNGKCYQTLLGHTGSVETLAEFNEGVLLSGSWDETIKIWANSH